MRNITKQCAKAFLDGELLYTNNTLVVMDGIYLFGNRIAYWNTDSTVSITLAGHNTNTTKERLNGLLELMKSKQHITSKAGVPVLCNYVEDTCIEMDLYGEYTIPYEFPSPTPLCTRCDAPYPTDRRALGYDTCLGCGEEDASEVKHTIAPMHKSNYMVISDREDLKGLNNKGGLIR